jgi:hypothetical protein
MTDILYSEFRTPEEANLAGEELASRGVDHGDMLVITKYSYKDPAFDADDERFELLEPVVMDFGDMPVQGSTQPARTDPFGEVSGEVWLLNNMRFPGDLTKRLRDLGFSRKEAFQLEKAMIDGGAIMMLRLPSRSIDEFGAAGIIKRYQGRIFDWRQSNQNAA